MPNCVGCKKWIDAGSDHLCLDCYLKSLRSSEFKGESSVSREIADPNWTSSSSEKDDEKPESHVREVLDTEDKPIF